MHQWSCCNRGLTRKGERYNVYIGIGAEECFFKEFSFVAEVAIIHRRRCRIFVISSLGRFRQIWLKTRYLYFWRHTKKKSKNLAVFTTFFPHLWWFKTSNSTLFCDVEFWISLFDKILLSKKWVVLVSLAGNSDPMTFLLCTISRDCEPNKCEQWTQFFVIEDTLDTLEL